MTQPTSLFRARGNSAGYFGSGQPLLTQPQARNDKQPFHRSVPPPGFLAGNSSSSASNDRFDVFKNINTFGESDWPPKNNSDEFRSSSSGDLLSGETAGWTLGVGDTSSGASYLQPTSSLLSRSRAEFIIKSAAPFQGRSSVSPASTGSSATSDVSSLGGSSETGIVMDGGVSSVVGWPTEVGPSSLRAQPIAEEGGTRSETGGGTIGDCFGLGGIGSWLETYISDTRKAKSAAAAALGKTTASNGDQGTLVNDYPSRDVEMRKPWNGARRESRSNRESEFIFYSDEEDGGGENATLSVYKKRGVPGTAKSSSTATGTNNTYAASLGWSSLGSSNSTTLKLGSSFSSQLGPTMADTNDTAVVATTATWSQIAAKKPESASSSSALKYVPGGGNTSGGTTTGTFAGSASVSKLSSPRSGSPNLSSPLPPPEYHRGPKVG